MKRLILLIVALATPCAWCAGGKGKAPTAKSSAKPAVAKAPTVTSLLVEPKEIALVGPRATQRLVATARFGDGTEREVTGQVKFVSSAPKLIGVDKDGVAFALNEGTATVRAEFGGKAVPLTVSARATKQEVPVNFLKEVVPIMAKAGCNQGACHGAQHGKGGFKTSLFGYEPEVDYRSMVKEKEGRRVVVSEPEASLVLLKPSMQVPHGGGLRIDKESWQYRVMKQWVEDGAPGLETRPPSVARIEVFPAERVMREGERQRLVVRAHWSDGTVEDISRKAIYGSNAEGLAAVTPEGLVEVKGTGATSIMVRYMGGANVFRVDVPYADAKAPLKFARRNYVDEHVVARWQRLGLVPSGDADDYEFIRRVYLDGIGTLPTPEAIKAFAASQDPEKRKQLIDEVLNRPEYADFWTLKWADLLRNNSQRLQEKGMCSFHLWIRAQMRDNKPLDQFVRDILTAQGSTYSNGPANFFRVAANSLDRAEAVAQTFLGIRMQCARCHHHPFEKWSQDDYYGLAAFFARVNTKTSQEFGLFGGEQVVVVQAAGEVAHPKRGGVVKPTPLEAPSVEDPIDRRRALASWLTSPDNMLFARNVANRFWGYLLGRGLVEPIDDMRATNPPSNPELLDALAKDFIAHKFDQKHLLRTIMNSHAYQLSSEATRANKRDDMFHSHFLVRRLTAEQLFDAVNSVTQTQDKFTGLPLGTRAIQLPDPAVNSYFLDTFGRAARQINCECERSSEPNMSQALHLMNSDFIQGKLTNGNGRAQRLLKENKTNREIIEEFYFVTFSRPPLDDELEIADEIITKAPSRKEGVEDLLWALINSREFIFNH